MSAHLGLRHKLFAGLTATGLLVCVGVASCIIYVSQESRFWGARAENRERYANSLQLEVTFERFHSALLNAALTTESVPVPAELIREMDDGIGRMGQLRLPPESTVLRLSQREWEALRNAVDDLPAGTADERKLFFEKYIRPGINRLRHELSNLTRFTRVFAETEIQRLNQEEKRIEILIAAVLATDALLIAVVAALVIIPTIRPLRRVTEMIRQLQAGEFATLVADRKDEDRDELVSTVQQFAAQLQDQRKTDEARMKRMELSIENAINGLADGVAVINPTGTIEVANQVAQRLFGIKANESIESIDLPWLKALMEQGRTADTNVVTHDASIQIFDERRERFFAPRLAILRRDNEIQGYTLVLTDTTMVRQIEEAKSSLIATVSHELKTPLTSIQMAIHLLLDGVLGNLNSKQTELMVAARDDTTRLHQMIERLLDAGRLHAHVELQFQEYLPHVLAQQVKDQVKGRLEFENLVPQDLPPVLADYGQINSATEAALGAAHSLKGSTAAKMEATAHQQYVDFTVTLKGELDSEHSEAFFEKMMIIKEIITSHGGLFEVQTESGASIAFRFTLRRADITAKEKTAADGK